MIQEKRSTTILLLGGTTEAKLLTGHLTQYKLVYSLAGRTAFPDRPDCTVRIGGFGGTDGLVQYILDHHIDLIINATHPYANKMSANALQAATRLQLPLLRFLRPAWRKAEADIWHEVTDEEELLTVIEKIDGSAFIALGAQGAGKLQIGDWHHPWIIRSTENAPHRLGRNVIWITARGPFTPAQEKEFFHRYHIAALFCRNSGGTGSYAKIVAARETGTPVYMLKRPPYEGPFVSSVSEVLDWIAPFSRT